MKTVQKMLYYFLFLSFPLLLIGSSIRLALSPIFLEVEYRLPGVPDDLFGFTFEERLKFAELSSDYLINSADIKFLANIKTDDGQPLFNQRELSHMQDVKKLTQSALKIWYLLLILWAGSIFFFWKRKSLDVFWKSILNGGWLTIALMAGTILMVLLNFNALFTAFHRVFFIGDTWLFYTSDSLIRLFPQRFWMDVFFFIGGLSLALSVLAIYLGRRFANPD